MPTIGLILLAAGASKRMGRPKQFLKWNGKSLLRRAANTGLVAGCSPVIAVVGAHAAECRAEIQDLHILIEENSDWERGMGTSIRAGLRALLRAEPAVAGTLIALCDQPLVTAADLQRLMATEKPVCAAAYDDTVGPPCFFAASYFSRLLALPDGQGAKSLLLAAGEALDRVDIPGAATDVDTPEDYDAIGR